ncbi:MAG: hypothetical protein R3C28_12350 [Pirellulaceae bacterium]
MMFIMNGATAAFADTREWLVHFDPLPTYFVAFPVFVILLPMLTLHSLLELPRKVPLFLVFTAEMFWILMILSGWQCRDMFLNFRWPGEPVTLMPQNNKNLSELIWLWSSNTDGPDNPLLREMPGLFLLVLYFLLAMLWVHWGTKWNLWQRTAISFIHPLIVFFPTVMLIKCSCNLKYILSFPEAFLNL